MLKTKQIEICKKSTKKTSKQYLLLVNICKNKPDVDSYILMEI